jgi:multiple sugar transport system substrate-binding protein
MARRFFSLAMVCLLACAVLLPVTAAANEKITIRFQDWRLAEQPSGKILEGMLREFEKLHPNVTIKAEPIPAAERDRMFIVQSSGKDAPDIVRVLPSTLPKFVELGYVMNLSKFAKKEKGFAKTWVPHLYNSCLWNGQLYGVPSEGDVYVLYINTEIYKNAGLDPKSPPTTWERWLADMKKITNPQAGIYGTAIQGQKGTGGPLYLQNFLLANGTDFYDEKYSKVLMDSKPGIEAFKFFIELHTKYKVIPPAPAEVGYNECVTLFANGKIGTLMLHGVGRGVIVAKNPAIESKMIAVRMPGKSRASAGRGSLHAISSQSKNPEIAWELLKFLNTKEKQLVTWNEAKVFPSRFDALNDSAVTSDPIAKVIFEESKYGKPGPLTPAWPQTGAKVMEAIQEALLGVKSPEQAIRDAAAEARRHLSELKKP